MADNTKQQLFGEFPAVTTEQWESVITADLKGADYERKLVWRTDEGFNVRPYYRAENLEGIKFLGTASGQFPYVRGVCKNNKWRIHQTVGVKCPAEANATALKLLASGVNSIGFCVCKPLTEADVATLLAGVDFEAAEVTICGSEACEIAEGVIALVKASGADPAKVRLNFSIDPIIKEFSKTGEWCCEDGTECFEYCAELVKMTEEFKRVRTVTVNGAEFHNSGSTIVQELAFSLAVGHEYLVKLMQAGLTIDQAARTIRFSLAVSSNYFMEIAKFRAGRLLWSNIVKAYNPAKECSCKMYTHAVTSKWNQTVYDPYVNMLRGTTESMSAAIAGVNSLETTPFNASFQEPTDFSRRIARNVQLLLKHESHFDQVSDPAGGSYYIENLTQSVAEQAWKLFTEVEDKGGYIEAFKAGFITDAVDASAAAKDKAVMTRRQVLLGANQYPNFTEVADAAITEECVTRQVSDKKVLKPYRGAMAFEAMRLSVDRSGKEPKAFMLTCGSLSMARARAQFSCNFFACAGIRVQDNTFFQSVEEGVKAALDSKAEIVVICASDDDYATVAPEINKMIDGKAIVVVAGAPACQAELEAQGITNFISVKSNVLETLKSYLKQLGI